jgi:hypothetical protein
MEGVGIFHGHLVYFMAIWYILWPYGIDYGYLLHCPQFWYVLPRKIWQPCFKCQIFLLALKKLTHFKCFFPTFYRGKKYVTF